MAHPSNESEQSILVGMGRIAAYGMNLRPNVIGLSVHYHESTSRPEALDLPPDRTVGLVADKQNVVPGIAEHGLEVVDDATAGAHAVTGDDDGRLRRLQSPTAHREAETAKAHRG